MKGKLLSSLYSIKIKMEALVVRLEDVGYNDESAAMARAMEEVLKVYESVRKKPRKKEPC